MLISLPRVPQSVTTWQPIHNRVCPRVRKREREREGEGECACDEVQARLRSLKLCRARPQLSCPHVEGPGGRSALRDRVHGHFCARRRGVTDKKCNQKALPAKPFGCGRRAEEAFTDGRRSLFSRRSWSSFCALVICK